MELKLFDSELKVMDTLWKAGGDLSAGQIAKILQQETGWNRNTTGELISKMFDGSKQKFFAAFLSEGELTQEEVMQLKEMVSGLGK